MIITIDGSAGTGKSTVAKKVAEKLGITFFDTGALYRAFAWYSRGKEDVRKAAQAFAIDITEGERRYIVEGEDITELLRTPEITALSSELSQYPFVREAMNGIQKRYASSHDTVFEGRDIGSVVFPDAAHKFFLTARPEVRAKRRFDEMQRRGMAAEYDQVLANIIARDHADSTREIAPLKKPDGARSIDTSDLTIEEVVCIICEEVSL